MLQVPILNPLLRLSVRREAGFEEADARTFIEHRPSAIVIAVDCKKRDRLSGHRPTDGERITRRDFSGVMYGRPVRFASARIEGIRMFVSRVPAA